MRKIFSFVFLLLFSMSLFAYVGYEESVKGFTALFSEVIERGDAVAFVALDSDSDEFKNRFWSDIEYYLMDDGVLVLDRRNTEDVLKELQMQTSGIVNEREAVSIGKAIGAKHLILGEARNMVSYFSVKLRLVDAETGRVERLKSYDIRYDDDLKRVMETPSNIEGSKKFRVGNRIGYCFEFNYNSYELKDVGLTPFYQPQSSFTPSLYVSYDVGLGFSLETGFDLFLRNSIKYNETYYSRPEGGTVPQIVGFYPSLDVPLRLKYKIIEKPLEVEGFIGAYASLPIGAFVFAENYPMLFSDEKAHGSVNLNEKLIPGVEVGVDCNYKLGPGSLSFGLMIFYDLKPISATGDYGVLFDNPTHETKTLKPLHRMGGLIHIGYSYKVD